MHLSKWTGFMLHCPQGYRAEHHLLPHALKNPETATQLLGGRRPGIHCEQLPEAVKERPEAVKERSEVVACQERHITATVS